LWAVKAPLSAGLLRWGKGKEDKSSFSTAFLFHKNLFYDKIK